MTSSRCAPLGQSERSVRRAIGGARAALAQYVYVGWLAERVRETCAAAAGGAVGLAGPELPVRRPRLGLGTGWSLSASAPAAFRKATVRIREEWGGVGGGLKAERLWMLAGRGGGFVQAAGLLQFGLALGPAGLGRAVPVSDCLCVMWPRGRRWPRYRVTVFWFLLAFFPPLGLLSSTEAFLCLTGFICFYL